MDLTNFTMECVGDGNASMEEFPIGVQIPLGRMYNIQAIRDRLPAVAIKNDGCMSGERFHLVFALNYRVGVTSVRVAVIAYKVDDQPFMRRVELWTSNSTSDADRLAIAAFINARLAGG